MSLPAFETLRRGLIVSVQAPEGSPMRHPQVIAAMAEASLCNGAVGVRLESPEHIGAVLLDAPYGTVSGYGCLAVLMVVTVGLFLMIRPLLNRKLA